MRMHIAFHLGARQRQVVVLPKQAGNFLDLLRTIAQRLHQTHQMHQRKFARAMRGLIAHHQRRVQIAAALGEPIDFVQAPPRCAGWQLALVIFPAHRKAQVAQGAYRHVRHVVLQHVLGLASEYAFE